MYGFSSQQIKYLIASYEHLSRGITETMSILNKAAKDFEDNLITNNNLRTAKAWIENYKSAQASDKQIKADMQACSRIASDIQKELTSLSLKERLEAAKEATQQFAQTTSIYTYHVHQLFGIELPKPILPAASSALGITQSSSSSSSNDNSLILKPAASSIVSKKEVSLSTQNNNLQNLDDDLPRREPPAILKKELFLHGKTKRKLDDADIAETAGLLRNSPGIEVIELQKNDITAKGAVVLFGVLQSYVSITEINLWNNKIGVGGAAALANLLKTHVYLATVIINQNEIREEGAVELAKGLRDNQSLISIDCGYNEIGDGGVIAIANAVMEHPKLRELKLSNNLIGIAGAQVLRELIKTNKRICLLDLNDNPSIPADLLKEINNIVKHNKEELEAKNQPRLTTGYPQHGHFGTERNLIETAPVGATSTSSSSSSTVSSNAATSSSSSSTSALADTNLTTSGSTQAQLK